MNTGISANLLIWYLKVPKNYSHSERLANKLSQENDSLIRSNDRRLISTRKYNANVTGKKLENVL